MESIISPSRPEQPVACLPIAPIFGWASFSWSNRTEERSIDSLPHVALTSSGRAAIYQALLQLQLPPDSAVLVPTYHCPAIVAPVLQAGLQPEFFGIGTDGLPRLDLIEETVACRSKAIIVSHYFGIARSLSAVRQWCDERGIALIEDCAHCYFGEAGERIVGAWGDYSTASVTKFFPVAEAGVLASMHRPIKNLRLDKPRLKQQAKACVDILEDAAKYRGLTGLNGILSSIMRFKRSALGQGRVVDSRPATAEQDIMLACDMARIGAAPAFGSLALHAVLPRGRIVAARQRNFSIYADQFKAMTGARALFPMVENAAAPYAFPLWVDDSDYVYYELRNRGLPVFRWDRIWPGTPRLEDDLGPQWSRHVLHLLCHQDLSATDVKSIGYAVQELVGG